MVKASNREQLLLLLIDGATVNVAWALYYLYRVRAGLVVAIAAPDFWMPMAVVCLFWLLVFFVYGLYRPWYAQSRFDEFATVMKAATVGVLFLFFAVFIDDRGVGS